MCAIASLEIVIRPSSDESVCSASTDDLDRQGSTVVAVATLDGFLDLAGLEAARADVGALGRAVHEDPDLLEVRVEAALGGDHRVASVLAETGLLPTD